MMRDETEPIMRVRFQIKQEGMDPISMEINVTFSDFMDEQNFLNRYVRPMLAALQHHIREDRLMPEGSAR